MYVTGVYYFFFVVVVQKCVFYSIIQFTVPLTM